MGPDIESRPSDSPYVERVWRSRSVQEGVSTHEVVHVVLDTSALPAGLHDEPGADEPRGMTWPWTSTSG
jgi:hypothetical protein